MPQTARKRETGSAATSRASRTQRRRSAGDGAAKRKTAAEGARRAVKAATSAPTLEAKGVAKSARRAVKAATSAPTDAKGVAEAARPKRVAGKLAGKAIMRAVRMGARGAGRVAASGLRATVSGVRSLNLEALLARARSLPIQRSVDVAVPLEVAWDLWEDLRFIPEGTHRVADIEREDDEHLVGRVKGLRAARDWEAEVTDERVDESFAWHSVGGSDCSGLVTFHRIGDRLTRLELHLDVIPGGVGDGLELVTRIADRRADADLRRFKAYAETLDPDEYHPLEDDSEPDDDVDGEEPDDDVDGEYDTEED